MKSYALIFASFMLTFIFSPAAHSQNSPTPGKISSMLQKSAQEKKSTFIMVWNEENESTSAMKKIFDQASAKFATQANAVAVKLDDPAEQEIISKYRLNTAPMPLILTIAPNGAITGAFLSRVDLALLEKSLVSEVEADCMKSLQEGKIVFVCIQDQSTTNNKEAMQGVNDYINDGNQKTTHVITVSPNDKKLKSFLEKLGVFDAPATATTYLLKPPGVIGAKFEGATSKEKIKIIACTKGCC